MKKIINFCSNHPLSVFMLYASFLLCFAACLKFISIDYTPELSPRHVLVNICYDGLDAEDIRKMVTIPTENIFGSVKYLKNMTSTSRDGISLLDLEFQYGVNMESTYSECRKLCDVLSEILPSGCSNPQCFIVNNKEELLCFCVLPVNGNLIEARRYCENVIVPIIERIKGVDNVTIEGGEKEEIQVVVEKEKAEKLHITLAQISDTLSSNNYEYPAGMITEGEKELCVKTEGLFTSLGEIENCSLIPFSDNGQVLVRDIAQVKRGVAPKEFFTSYNGVECIKLSVYRNKGYNPILISSQVKKTVYENTKSNRYDIKLIKDLSDEMTLAVSDLIMQTLAGTAAVILVVKFFIGSFLISIIAACSIPFSFMVAIMVLTVTGFSINTISITGFTLSLGMVVDCSTVVVQSIINHRSPGKGAISVVKSCIISSITSIIVFLPFMLYRTSFTELFSSMAVTIVSSIVFSFLISFTFVVSFSTAALGDHIIFTESRQLAYIKILYFKFLKTVKGKQSFLILVSLIFLLAGLVILRIMNFEIYKSEKFDHVVVEINLDQNMSIDGMYKESLFLQSILSKLPDVDYVLMSGGISNDDNESLMSPYKTSQLIECYIKFKDKLKKIPEEVLSVLDQYGQYEIICDDVVYSNLLNVSGKFLALGDSPEEVRKQCLDMVKSGSCNVVPFVDAIEYSVELDRAACAKYDVKNSLVQSIVADAINGINSSDYYESGHEIGIRVKYEKDSVKTIKDIEYLYIPCGQQQIPLHVLCSVKNISREKIFYRYNKKDCKIIDKSLSENLFNPELEENRKVALDFILMLVFIVLFLYLVSGMFFESFTVPLMMLSCVPSVFCGWILSISVVGLSFDFSSLLGLIVLLGNAVNNFVIMYEKCEQDNSNRWYEVVYSSVDTVNALMITNFTTIIALIPFSFQSSTALGIIGGIIFSLIFTLSAGPLMISFYRRKNNQNVPE